MEGIMNRSSGFLALAAFLSFSLIAPLSFAGEEEKKEEKKGGHVVVLSDDKQDEKKEGGK
jgi:hypothetical protein